MTEETVVEEGTGELDELQARMVEITSILEKRAPNLRPMVHPRLYRQTVDHVKTLVASKAGELTATAVAAAAAAPVAAEKTGSEGEEHEAGESAAKAVEEEVGKRHVVVETETDVATRTFRITGAKLAGKIEATLSNLELLMDLHLNASEEELRPYVARFASANELDSSSSGKTAASVLQEVCSLGYALQVSVSNIAGWTGYVGPFQLPLADDADMMSVLRELFTPPPPPPSPPSSPRPKSAAGKKGKGRSKGKLKGAGGGAKNSNKGGAAGAAAGGGEGVEQGKEESPKRRRKGGKGVRQEDRNEKNKLDFRDSYSCYRLKPSCFVLEAGGARFEWPRICLWYVPGFAEGAQCAQYVSVDQDKPHLNTQ